MKSHFTIRAYLVLAALFTLTNCTKKNAPEGFGRFDSPIRYKTVTFENPEILAEANGVEFTKEQILDKSPVLKDLDQQLIDVTAGLAYMTVAGSEQRNTGTLTIYLKTSTQDMDQILVRLGSKTTPGLKVVFATPKDESTIASIGDKRFRKEDVGINNFVYRSIEQRRFEEISQQLNSQAARILLAQEAQKSGMGIQEFVKAKVAKDNSPISSAQVAAYLKTRGITESDLSEEQKEQIAQTLKANREQKSIEEYVATHILKGPMKVSFTQPHLPLEVSSEFTPIEGYKSAPVSVVIFSAANCPDCLKVVDSIDDVAKEYAGYLKLNWIHQFDPKDGLAKMLAEGALCAENQKRGATLKFFDAVSADGASFNEQKMYSWGKANKINEQDFRDCVIQHKHESLLSKHLAYTASVGIVSNPTVWINGNIISGFVDKKLMQNAIEQSIAMSGETAFSAWWRRMKAKLGWD